MALPAFVWVEIEASTVEVHGRLEVLGVAEAAGCLLDPLDHRVDAFEAGVGQAMPKVSELVEACTRARSHKQPVNADNYSRH
jgi:hypothetical protein